MDFNYVYKAELSRSTRDASPGHYRYKVESFSSFSETSIERWESDIFEVDGYKWKLAFYPNGNKDKDVRDHISLYLVMVDTKPSLEVEAIFRFFIFDHIQDKYITVQDLRSRRFHWMKAEWGFDRFVSLKTFNDPSSGCLVDDTCLFGVEVFVCNKANASKNECLSRIKNSITYTHIWKIARFSQIVTEIYYSEAFTVGGYKWKIHFYPKGYGPAKGTSLSIYLALDQSTFAQNEKVYVEYSLRIIDQIHSKHVEFKHKRWFDDPSTNWGTHSLLSLSDLNDKTKGFLVEDCCKVEADVNVVAKSKKIS